MAAIVGVVGGTGKQGSGLVRRWARARDVILGSRDPDRAALEARACGEATGAVVRSGTNAEAARGADLVVLCVPYAAHAETLRELAADLQGKIVIDLTVPLVPPRVTVVHLPAGRAAALEAQAILGPGVRVVAALHHVSSAHLADLAHPLAGDVLVCGDDPGAKAAVIELVGELGVRGLDAGVLENAIAIEALTPVLLHINRTYKARGAGLRILGLP